MKDIKRKAGFTLIELLAVIVILAVLILLAVPSVLKMMDNARKSTFTTEAESFINGAKLAYAQAVLDGSTQTCFKLTSPGSCVGATGANANACKTAGGKWNYTVSEFVDKKLTAYSGSIKIDAAGSAHQIWVSNGTYSITAGTSGGLTLDTTTDVNVSPDCGTTNPS